MSNTSGDGGSLPPGWYKDNQGTMRWWNGSAFTEHTQETASNSAGATAAPPPPGTGEKTPWYKKKLWWAVAAIVIIFALASAGGGSEDGDGDDQTTTATDTSTSTPKETKSESKAPKPKAETKSPKPKPEPKPDPKVIKVAAAKILQEFEENEAAADLKYGDHQLLEVTGFVSKVDTELLHDDRYVIQVAGPDYEYAFTAINCDGQSAEDVAKIKVGQKITVGGDFQDGGDLGIELGGCHVV